MKHALVKKIACLLLALLVCFSLAGETVCTTVHADPTEEELKEKMKELQEQLDQLNEQMEQAKDAAAEAEKRAQTYAARVAIVEQQVDTLQDSIDVKRDELSVKQEQLDLKQREYDESYELFKQRVRAMYMNNNVSALSLILGARTFSEFLVAATTQSSISKHDTDLIDRLDREAKEIEREKTVIEDDLATLEKDMDTLETKYKELAGLYREANRDLSEAEALERATQKEYDAILQEYEDTQEEWEKLMNHGMSGYVGGYYAWPVPGYYTISSGFGWRKLYGKDNFHKGIDIAGRNAKGERIYGAPIIASNTGKVVRARYYTTGYGYHVMIDHGDNNWTVYGHMSAIAVKEGEWVVQGQVIGYVGSTGNSTGPHLHFEIRLNGKAVNPLDYVVR